MNQYVKKMLITGVSFFMAAGIGAGINNVVKPAHADMSQPVYYRSTRHKDPVYYQINSTYDHDKKCRVHYVYTRMPNVMRRRSFIFGLYYGGEYTKEPVFKILHRHGQTYLPEYTGAVNNIYNIRFHGYKGELLNIYVNKRDVGRRVRNQNKAASSRHAELFANELGFSNSRRTRKHRRHDKQAARQSHKSNYAKRHAHRHY